MPGAKVAIDRRGLDAAAKKWVEKQVPYATSLAINSIATGLKTDLRESMRATFNNPNAYTLGSVFVSRATKARLTAVVGLKDVAAGGATPAWKYLGPEAFGGARNRKRFEIALGGNGFSVPGRAAKLDASGDMDRTQLGVILSVVRNETPVTVKVAKRLGKAAYRGAKKTRSAFFVGRKNGVPTGVYQVVAKGEVAPVVVFRPEAPTYSARWDYKGTVLASVRKHEPGAFDRAMAQALTTAK